MKLQVPYRVVLFAALLFVAWTLFWQLTVLLLAALLTAIIALPLTAATDWLQRHHIPRPIGAIGSVVLGLVAIAVAVMFAAPPIVAQVERLLDDLPEIVERVRMQLAPDGAGRPDRELGFELRALLQRHLADPTTLLGPVMTVLSNAAAVIGGALLVLLTATYAAVDPRPLVAGIVRLAPPRQRPHAEHILRRLRASWLGWLTGTAIDMALTGALTFAALSLLGIEHALVFATLTALLEIVPYFGPILAAVPPVLYALTQSTELALLTLGAYIVIQQIEGNVILPLVMSQTVRLHPALLAIGVVVTGQLFGILGVLLAVPILTAVVVLVQELWVLPQEEHARQRRASSSGQAGRVTDELVLP